MELGNKLLELRKNNGFSQEELAEKVEVSRQTISKWELNESSPNLKQAKQLSKILNVSLDELVNNDIKDILTEKISNVEKLTGLAYKILKGLLIAIVVFIVLFIFSKLFHVTPVPTFGITGINCELDGKHYSINIITSEPPRVTSIFNKNNYDYDNILINNITIFPYISIPDIEKYQKKYQVTNVVFNYFELKGGSCH
jgi:transcriptional regulator with XRE-family HTH domain